MTCVVGLLSRSRSSLTGNGVVVTPAQVLQQLFVVIYAGDDDSASDGVVLDPRRTSGTRVYRKDAQRTAPAAELVIGLIVHFHGPRGRTGRFSAAPPVSEHCRAMRFRRRRLWAQQMRPPLDALLTPSLHIGDDPAASRTHHSRRRKPHPPHWGRRVVDISLERLCMGLRRPFIPLWEHACRLTHRRTAS